MQAYKKNTVCCYYYSNTKSNLSKNSARSIENSKAILYQIYLPNYEGIENNLYEFLDTGEISRASRYYKAKDKNRFVICRGLLKFVLAYHAHSDINNILIDLLPNKKPYLSNHPNIFFNVSHSGDYAVLAVSTAPIGIDIEYIDLNYHFQETLPYIFNIAEIDFINHADHKSKAFYSLWTRKEAFVKALGKGIDDDFLKIPCLNGIHSLDASLIESSQNWQVCNFNMADENYLGAIARPIDEVSNVDNILFHTLPNTMEDLIKLNF